VLIKNEGVKGIEKQNIHWTISYSIIRSTWAVDCSGSSSDYSTNSDNKREGTKMTFILQQVAGF